MTKHQDYKILHISSYDIVPDAKIDNMPLFESFCQQNHALLTAIDIDRIKEMLNRSGLTQQLDFFIKFMDSHPAPATKPGL